MTAYADIARDGLWRNNAGLVQLLGLCPLLAVSTRLVNGLALGIATLLVLVGSGLCVSLIRKWLRPEVRIAVFVLIIGSLVSLVELAFNAWFYELSLAIGIFVPLIVSNCAILARAETFAAHNPPAAAAFDGLMTGAGFAAVLIAFGGLRELVGSGTLLAGSALLFGTDLTVHVPAFGGFRPALLPPGAFIGLALAVAGRNVLQRRHRNTATASAVPAADAAS